MQFNDEVFDEIMESEINSDGERISYKSNVSPAVIKRLPRYFRYLRILIREGKTRVSSGELSRMMKVTASQIRQDLNCFGGFGQQGYGYNVNYLYAKISELLGVSAGLSAVVIGAGNIGSAIVRNPMFEKRGVDTIAMFDTNPAIIGKIVGGVKVYDVSELERFCESNRVDIAVLALPKEATIEMGKRIGALGIPGVWNFTGQEIELENTVIENVHLGDSLMTLTYRLCEKREQDRRAAEGKGVSDEKSKKQSDKA